MRKQLIFAPYYLITDNLDDYLDFLADPTDSVQGVFITAVKDKRRT